MFKAYGLYSHIQANRLRSLFLLAGFVLLLVALLYSFTLLYEAAKGGTLNEIMSAAWSDLGQSWPFALIGALIWFGIAFLFHQAMIDGATGAKGVERQQEPRLYNAIENLCISRGIPMPKLKIIETDGLNAFASGIRRSNYSIAVTRGLLNTLNDAELEAVLGHELTHIRNRDTQMMVIAVIFAGIFAFVADLTFRSWNFPFGYGPRRPWRYGTSSSSSDSGRRGGSGGAIIAIIIALAIILITWGVSVLIRFAISRSREFMADAGSVELTKNPDAMISALRKIERHATIPEIQSRMYAFFIESPAVRPETGWFATHPDVEARIAALIKYAGGRDVVRAVSEGPWEKAAHVHDA